MLEKIVGLLPMKGHSERVPGKNLRLLCGKPLCFWVLETLYSIPRVSGVVVDTDSEEIARTVQASFPVTIHWRPEEICGDNVSMNRVIAHDLSLLEGREHFLQTHATNPLLKRETMEFAIEEYFSLTPPEDSIFSVTRHQARFYDEKGAPINHHLGELLRTQDLAPVYQENANFFLFSRKSFALNLSRLGNKPRLFPMNELEATDIDEEIHWEMAEFFMSRKH